MGWEVKVPIQNLLWGIFLPPWTISHSEKDILGPFEWWEKRLVFCPISCSIKVVWSSFLRLASAWTQQKVTFKGRLSWLGFSFPVIELAKYHSERGTGTFSNKIYTLISEIHCMQSNGQIADTVHDQDFYSHRTHIRVRIKGQTEKPNHKQRRIDLYFPPTHTHVYLLSTSLEPQSSKHSLLKGLQTGRRGSYRYGFGRDFPEENILPPVWMGSWSLANESLCYTFSGFSWSS